MKTASRQDTAHLATLAERINAEHEAGEKALQKGLTHYRKAGEALIEAKAKCEHERPKIPWLRWLKDNVSFPERKAQRYMELASSISDVTSDTGQEPSVEEQLQLWAGISGNASDKTAHVSHNSGENEWYTPPEYIEAARAVLGVIHLDPASSDKAQETVGAETHFTKDDDGLAQAWSGNVWLNPPYAADLVEKFIDKLCEHIEAEDVPSAILLVNNATETKWFQKALRLCAAGCFPEGRIKFHDKTGEPANTPLQGQSFLYFGKRPALFVERFKQFGACARTV